MPIQKNQIQFTLSVDQTSDTLNLKVEHNLSATMYEDQHEFYLDLINGLISKINTGADELAFQGSLLREISNLRSIIDDLDEDDDEGITFEPDEMLLKALKDRNVISIKKKMH
tara:strand:- start:289 stop:627 length:339 start_codon:yes stop_codon:yes gene_type:complete